MRRVVGLIAQLAARAGADVRRAGSALATTAPAAAAPQPETTADRAGRLVPLPQDSLEVEVSRSIGSHWALWLAVILIVLVLALGYIRRRWRGRHRPARLPWPVFGRGSARK